jgi:hypothetical protein
MPIVGGVYEAKISTTYRSNKQAIIAIKKAIEKARVVRISNLPARLVKKLAPLLKGKDVKVILPRGSEVSDELKQLGDVAIQKAKIYKDHKGVEANLGSIQLSDVIFDVAWTNSKILQIDAMNYDKCVKCMKKVFDMGWRYAQKVKT